MLAVSRWHRLSRPAAVSVILIAGFVLAVVARVMIGGLDVAQSATAGLAFAVGLLVMSLAVGVSLHSSRKAVLAGFVGGVFLCLPAFVAHYLDLGQQTAPTASGYAGWVLVVGAVAFSEEVFLRGALYEAIERWRGTFTAIVVGAVLFTGLHIPLYGWQVVPLDFAVGLFLGALRLAAGSFIAPSIAHTLADLVGWWLH